MKNSVVWEGTTPCSQRFRRALLPAALLFHTKDRNTRLRRNARKFLPDRTVSHTIIDFLNVCYSWPYSPFGEITLTREEIVSCVNTILSVQSHSKRHCESERKGGGGVGNFLRRRLFSRRTGIFFHYEFNSLHYFKKGARNDSVAHRHKEVAGSCQFQSIYFRFSVVS